MMPVLDVKNLNKRFGSVVAAADINVSVSRGERLGLIGTNGAGKTTFVNMVTGYITPSSGSISLEGVDITGQPPRTINRAGVSRSFQIPQLFLTLTTEENLLAALGAANGYGGRPYKKMDAVLGATLEELLNRFKLIEHRRKPVAHLSGGVRKLIDIAIAVTRRPKVLLLDEPSSGVSSEQKFELMDIVMDALDDDVTVLFVEHDMDIVGRYAQRVLAFFDGTIIADGTPQAVLAEATVKAYIVGSAT
jgi:branched-chain amino acid transport system ATP-binding protein